MKKIAYFFLITALLLSCESNLDETSSISNISNNTLPTTKSVEDGLPYKIIEPISFKDIHSPENWSRYTTLEEKFEACELSKDILENMSTEALLETCINHPLARLHFAYDDHLEYVDIFADHSSVFQEFLKREDASKTIIELYKKLCVQPLFEGIERTETGYKVSMLSECFIELIMGSGLIPDIVSIENAPTLSQIVENRLLSKQSDSDNYSFFSYESTLLMKDILSSQDTVLTKGNAKKHYHSLYEKYIIGPQTKDIILIPLGTTTVYTLFGKAVQGVYYKELTSSEMAECMQETYAFDNNAYIISGPTSAYNCHSYAWNIWDGGETCWINPYTTSGYQNVWNYWTNDYYGSTTNQSVADKAVYFYSSSPEHSAVQYSSGVWESKWGAGPVVRHSLTSVPYVYSSISYYAQTVHTVSMNVPATSTVGTPIVCSPGWLTNIDHTSCVWLITDHHDNESGYTQNPNGMSNTITFTETGSFEIDCSVYWYSTLVGHAHEQIIITN